MLILAGDIGGTHTRLALFEKGVKRIEKKFLSCDYPNLQEIVDSFLSTETRNIQAACFGIAGAVRRGICNATNLPWHVEASLLSRHLNISHVYLLNDLEANAYGLRVLQKKDFCCIQKGAPHPEGNQALISAGTGLGEAGLFWDGMKHHPFASEGGHVDFAPRNELEVDLFFYLRKKFQHVSYERVLSGPGLITVYQFLVETRRIQPLESIERGIKDKKGSLVITEHAKHQLDEGCVQTLDLFLSLYGAAAGNLALKYAALGGVYINGKIASFVLEQIKKGSFLESFLDKGRFRSFLELIPVFVLINNEGPLLGAAAYAQEKQS